MNRNMPYFLIAGAILTVGVVIPSFAAADTHSQEITVKRLYYNGEQDSVRIFPKEEIPFSWDWCNVINYGGYSDTYTDYYEIPSNHSSIVLLGLLTSAFLQDLQIVVYFKDNKCTDRNRLIVHKVEIQS